jgi:hypothetical protein
MRKTLLLLLFLLLGTILSAETIDVSDLLSAFDTNKVSAQAKYGKAPVTVKGIIYAVGLDVMGNPYVAISPTGGDMEMINARFFFQKSEAGKLVGLAKGSEITLRGKFDSNIMTIDFKGSSIVENTVAADPIKFQKEISALELFELYKKNTVGTDAVFRGKTITVTGAVVSIDTDIVSKAPYFIIGGTGSEYVPLGVRCLFPKGESIVANINKGDEVKVAGTLGTYLMNVDLTKCTIK